MSFFTGYRLFTRNAAEGAPPAGRSVQGTVAACVAHEQLAQSALILVREGPSER